jgi:5-methylthioribose kinase
VSAELLTVDTVADYIASQAHLAALVDPATLSVVEVGDGNLNLVFIATDAAGASLVLKQSLPYVRMVGESWPLSQDRILAEARGYDAAVALSPESSPIYYGFDEPRRIIAIEDLSDWTVWRRSLNEGRITRGAAAIIGRHIARIGFGTSVFGRPPADVKRAVAASINIDLCQISEDLVFTQPYIDHPDNAWTPGLNDAVLSLREGVLVDEIATLKHAFVTHAEALIHGDLHTGSIFVPADGAAAARIFDIEFSFYGPIAFDLGSFFGNVLLAQQRAAVLDRPAEFRAWLDSLIAEAWDGFATEFRALWPGRVDASYTDAFLESWLRDTWSLAVGFGGAKAIRRIVGLAKASDIESLEPEQHDTAAAEVLRIARLWVEQRSSIADPAELATVGR